MLHNPADAPPRGVALVLAGVLCVSGALAAGLAGWGHASSAAALSATAPALAAGAPGATADAAERSQYRARAQVVQPLLAARAAAVATGRAAAREALGIAAPA